MTSAYSRKVLKNGLQVLAIAISFALFFTVSNAAAAGTKDMDKGSTGYEWSKQADETFYLKQGMSEKLMTQEQWKQYQDRMQGMSAAEREEFRREQHKTLMDQAREKGFQVPDMPAEHGKGGTKEKGMILLIAAGSGGFGSSGVDRGASGRPGAFGSLGVDRRSGPGDGDGQGAFGSSDLDRGDRSLGAGDQDLNRGTLDQDMDANRGTGSTFDRDTGSSFDRDRGVMDNMNTDTLDRGLILADCGMKHTGGADRDTGTSNRLESDTDKEKSSDESGTMKGYPYHGQDRDSSVEKSY